MNQTPSHDTSRRFLPRWVLVLMFAVFVGILFAVRNFVFPEPYRDIDFSAYWAAARTAFVDHASPYGVDAPRLAQQRWMPERKEVPPFLYTPVALLAFGPLQWLEPLSASRLMLALNLLATVAMMSFLVRTLGLGSSRRVAWASAFYTLLFAPLYESVGIGQINLMMALLMLGAWHAYRSGRAEVGGGMAAASVVFLKLHFGLLLLPMLLRRRVALLGTFAATLVLGVGLSAVVFPFDAWGSWLEHVVRASSLVKLPRGLPSMAGPMNLSVPAMTARFLVPNPHSSALEVPPWLASAVPGVLCCVILAWTCLLLWRSSQLPRTPDRADAEVCLVLATAFELSPISWGHHLVFLLPTLLLLLRRVVLEPGTSRVVRLAVATPILLLALHPFVLGMMHPGLAHSVATVRSLAALAVWSAASAWVLRLAPARARAVEEPSAEAVPCP